MHTAKQLFPEHFEVQVEGAAGTLEDVFPHRHRFDRFGIVVAEPMASLGASLLIQAAITNWFEICPERRDAKPAYSEIYIFHVGGPHGDHSYFDFWPPRREVFVGAHDPVQLLGDINARGITRLAVPDGEPGDPMRLTWGPSTWAEQASARDRLQSCFAYSPRGAVPEADVQLSSSDPRVEENPLNSLNLLATTDAVHGNEGAKDFLPGLSVAVDNFRWIDSVRARRNEVPAPVRNRLASERKVARDRAGGKRIESFRRLDIEATLAMIAALD